MNEHALFRIKRVLHNMEAANDDISIANFIVYMAGGHKVEHIFQVEDAGDIIIFRSDEGHYTREYHVDPKHIIGFSHIKFSE